MDSVRASTTPEARAPIAVVETGRSVRVDLVDETRPEQRLDRPAELLDGAPVGIADPAVLEIEQEDGVAGRVEQPLEPDAFAEQAGVLDRAGGARRERLGERDVLGLEPPARLSVDEGQDAGDPAAAISGTMIAERSWIARSSSRWRSSTAAASICSGVMSGRYSMWPSRRIAAAPVAQSGSGG